MASEYMPPRIVHDHMLLPKTTFLHQSSLSKLPAKSTSVIVATSTFEDFSIGSP